ncbi:hypothetical protein RFI_16103, partial [Reticulomyxa filosa]
MGETLSKSKKMADMTSQVNESTISVVEQSEGNPKEASDASRSVSVSENGSVYSREQQTAVGLSCLVKEVEQINPTFYLPTELKSMILNFSRPSVFHLWAHGNHDTCVEVLNGGSSARCISQENAIAVVLFGDLITPDSGLKYRCIFKSVKMVNYQGFICVGEDFKYTLGGSWPEWPKCTQKVVIWYSDSFMPRWNISTPAQR